MSTWIAGEGSKLQENKKKIALQQQENKEKLSIFLLELCNFLTAPKASTIEIAGKTPLVYCAGQTKETYNLC